MAFKPFDYFRKHQKAVLATLAIVCMLVFIFSGFSGDPLKRLTDYIGSDARRGEVVAVLYKEKVRSRDIQELRDDRKLASEFIQVSFFFLAYREAKQEIENAKKAGGLSPEVNFFLQQSNPQGNGEMSLQLIGLLERFLVSAKGATLSSAEGKAINDLLFTLRIEAFQAAHLERSNDYLFGGTQSYEGILDHKIWLHQADRLGIDLVEEDLDKIVNYDAGRVILTKDLANDDRFKTFQAVSRGRRDIKPADLVRALTNEYRAAMAQEVLLGRAPGLLGYLSPSGGCNVPVGSVTLQQFDARFTAQNTQVEVALFPVPTEAFRSQVKGQPTEQEQQNLFLSFRKTLARPESPEPGLKIPRKIQVQYASLPADLPAFRDSALARQLVQTQLVQRLLADAAPTIPGGGGVATAVTADLLPLCVRPSSARGAEPIGDPILVGYADLVKNLQNQPWLAPSGQFDKFHDLSVLHVNTLPTQVAALVGLPALGNDLTPLVVGDSYLAAVYRSEYGERKYQIACVGNLVAGAGSSFVVPFQNPLQPFDTVAGFQAEDPSYRIMAPVLWAEAVKKAQTESYADELGAFTEQLARLRTSPEEAARFVERVNAGKPVKVDVLKLPEAVTLEAGNPLLQEDRSLKVGDKVYTFHLKGRIHSMPSPGDKAVVEASPELAGLREAFARPHASSKSFQGISTRVTMADHLFDPGYAGDYEVQAWSPEEGSPPGMGGQERPGMADIMNGMLGRQTHEVASRSKDTFLIWHSKSEPEREPANLKEVRPQILRAWQTLQARRKAQEAAAEIKKALGPSASGQQQEVEGDLVAAVNRVPGLKDVLAGQKPFVLHGVTRISRGNNPFQMSYEPYKPQEIDIKYPPAALGEQLLSLQKPGDAIVLADQPVDHFYVAVLISRTNPPAAGFENALKQVNPPGGQFGALGADSYWTTQVLDPVREAYRSDLIRQLRVEAVGADKLDESGKYILPDSLMKKSAGEE